MKFVLLLFVLCAIAVTKGQRFGEDPVHEVGDAINQITNQAEDVWDDMNGRSPFEKFIRKLGRAGIALGIKPEAFIVIVFVLALIFVALLLKCCCCSSSKQQRPTIIYAQPPYNNFK